MRIGNYVGVDMSREELVFALDRYNGLVQRHFPARFICADYTQDSIARALDLSYEFDIVSSMFSAQYAFSSEHNLRTFMRNVTDRLAPGGYFIGCIPNAWVLLERLIAAGDTKTFGNSLYSVTFDSKATDIDFIRNPFGTKYHMTVTDVFENVPQYLASPAEFER
eukprot:GEZU01024222.1.p1 GENE.GEZU01024222.1~~GEZU01024222.1.p1  ORF type:complete len:165 (-),score=33.42 GEZU01024222.1:831-1325(-)